jgi:hypothetical protein
MALGEATTRKLEELVANRAVQMRGFCGRKAGYTHCRIRASHVATNRSSASIEVKSCIFKALCVFLFPKEKEHLKVSAATVKIGSFMCGGMENADRSKEVWPRTERIFFK